MDSIKSIIRSYEVWVAANPETVGDLETTAKWVSYFVAGRISDSNVVSELIYSLSNILVLYNDRIITTTRDCVAEASSSAAVANGYNVRNNNNNHSICERLKVILTTLEYSEVFIEISAKRVFGSKGKWFFVIVLQVLKAAGRFFILKHSTAQIITSPAIPSLNRRAVIKSQKAGVSAASTGDGLKIASTEGILDEHSFTFKLKRSGRIIRKVEGAPPLQYRDFKLLADISGVNKCTVPTVLLRAEYLYIAKPLIHLAAMGVFGEKRWKQYVVALALDMISLRLYHKNRHLMNKEQRLEMSRRCINLLFYLMRSPFYEHYTQTRLERALDFIADNIPFIRMLAKPVKDYIPHWQGTYFYLWST